MSTPNNQNSSKPQSPKKPKKSPKQQKKQNKTPNAKKRSPATKLLSRQTQSVRLTKKEMWTTVTLSTSTETKKLLTWTANSTPPWFTRYVELYETYEIHRLRLIVNPSASAMTSGNHYLSFEPNPAEVDTAIPSIPIMLAEFNARMAKIRDTLSIDLPSSVLRSTPTRRFKTSFLAAFYYRAISSESSIVTFEVEYDITFHTPQLKSLPSITGYTLSKGDDFLATNSSRVSIPGVFVDSVDSYVPSVALHPGKTYDMFIATHALDFLIPGHKYSPFASLNNGTIGNILFHELINAVADYRGFNYVLTRDQLPLDSKSDPSERGVVGLAATSASSYASWTTTTSTKMWIRWILTPKTTVIVNINPAFQRESFNIIELSRDFVNTLDISDSLLAQSFESSIFLPVIFSPNALTIDGHSLAPTLLPHERPEIVVHDALEEPSP